ncbi:MAG: HEPN domain-containing protein [Anaerolineales bacterium]
MPELNIEKQIAYWRDGALDTWLDVEHCLSGGRIAFAMLAAHLTIEKAVKAHVVKKTQKLPPMIHNLLSLANLAGLKLTPQQQTLFAELNPLNIEARYGNIGRALTKAEAESIAKRTKVALEWLIKEL